MDYAVEGAPGKQRAHRRGVFEAALHKRKARLRAQPRHARLLERHVVIIVDGIKAGYGVAARQQRLRHVVANEAGRAGHEDIHQSNSC